MHSEKQAEDKKRILYIVSAYSSSNTGNGGHYYSLREISTAFAAAHPTTPVEILLIGNVNSEPLESAAVPVTQIDFSTRSLRSFFSEVFDFIRTFAPTHIHAFDNKSYFFARRAAPAVGAKLYLTKPGGPNPGIYFPQAPDVICFSEENLQNLKQRRRLKSSNLHYVPQRTALPEFRQDRMAQLRDLVGDVRIILRICRIGSYYRNSILQTFALADLLRAQGIAVSAVILGVVQEQQVLDEIISRLGKDDFIITDPAMTTNAAQLLPTADAVVGTGRNLVEAAMAGVTLFTPLANSALPAAVTIENWRGLAATNFSERNKIPAAQTPRELTAAFLSADRTVARTIADEYSIATAVRKYKEIYESAQSRHRHPIDYSVNAAAVIVTATRSRRARSK